MRQRARRLCLGLVASAVLAPSVAVASFLTQVSYASGGATFSFDVTAAPQWTLTTDGGGTVYSGLAMTTARFGPSDALAFTDERNIELNGNPITASLKGKFDRDCRALRIVLEDQTNGRTITMGPFRDGDSTSCSSSE